MKKVSLFVGLLIFAFLLMFTQQTYAQKQKKFDEAVAKGWIESKGYAYEDRVEGESKREKFKQKALEMGFMVHYFGVDYVYVYKISEKEKLDLDIEYEKRGREYETFRTGIKLSGSHFKNVGTAFAFFVQYANIQESGGYNDFRHLQICNDVKWSGNLKNGKLEGNGDGFCKIKKENDTYSCAFSGTFHDGFIEKASVWYYRDPNKIQKYEVEILPFSEGMSFMKDKTYGDEKWYYSLIDTNGNVISTLFCRPFSKLTDVKQNYINGKAVVTMNGMDVVINKKGEIIGIGDNTTTVTGEVFSQQSSYGNMICSTKSLILPSQIRVIQPHAFKKNKDLESVILPEGLKEIGLMAFHGCSSLRSITIPSTVTSIDKEAFYDCKNLTSATVPASLIDNIEGKYIFKGCDKLKEVNVIDENGNIIKDSNWYWKEEKDPEAEKRRQELLASFSDEGLTAQDFFALITKKTMKDVQSFLEGNNFQFGTSKKSDYYTTEDITEWSFGFNIEWNPSSEKWIRKSKSDFMLIKVNYDNSKKRIHAITCNFPYKKLRDAIEKMAPQKQYTIDKNLTFDNRTTYSNKDKDDIVIHNLENGTYVVEYEKYIKYFMTLEERQKLDEEYWKEKSKNK